jgi:hypothetical protein
MVMGRVIVSVFSRARFRVRVRVTFRVCVIVV